MADSFTEGAPAASAAAAAAPDVEMAEGSTAPASTAGAAENPNNSELPFAEDGPDDTPPARITFVQYLSSPVVTLLVGSGEAETILTAHQGLLM